METKTCSSCKIEKPRSEWYVRRKTGELYSYCIACTKAKANAVYHTKSKHDPTWVARNSASNKRIRDLNTKLILEAYGTKCDCCGEANPLFLTVDHINNDGAEHRRRLKNSSRVKAEIVRLNFPPEYRLLCYNCNSGRELNGGICPHNF
jgi:hypothetical protein